MNKSVKVTTLKGVEITLTASAFGVDAEFSLKGKKHSFNCIKRGYTATLGYFLELGPAKAVLDADGDAIAKAIFDEQAALNADWKKQYLASEEFKTEKFSADMHRRMYSPNSHH